MSRCAVSGVGIDGDASQAASTQSTASSQVQARKSQEAVFDTPHTGGDAENKKRNSRKKANKEDSRHC
ncbi:hypothetical protein GUJ93_ZPchr0006g45286, partial [Zizania palustris]